MKNKFFLIKILFSLIFTFLFAAGAPAAEKSFILKLGKDKVSPGKQTTLELVFSEDPGVEAPEITPVEGLEFRYNKSYSRGGEFIVDYKVFPVKEGNFTIGPISFRSGGNDHISNSVVLSAVREGKADRRMGDTAQKEPAADISGHVYAVVNCAKKELEVNEKSQVTVSVYSDWLDLVNVTVSEPESGELIMSRFKKKGSREVTEKGIKYIVSEFVKDVLSPFPGKYEFGAVAVKCEVVKREKNKDGSMPELLNDNEAFYGSFIGHGRSKALKLETRPFQIKVILRPETAANRPSAGTDGKDSGPSVSGGQKKKNDISGQDLVGLKTGIGKDVTGEAGYEGIPLGFRILFLGPLFIIMLGFIFKERVWLATSREPEAKKARAMIKAFKKLANVSGGRIRTETEIYDAIMDAVVEYRNGRFGEETPVITESDVNEMSGAGQINEKAAAMLMKFIERFNDVKYGGLAGGAERGRHREAVDAAKIMFKEMDKKVKAGG